MKRIAALILTVLTLCAGVAQAAGWEEGTGPAKPYPDVPEIDLEAQLGYMMFYPKDGMTVENACQRLYMYLPREDVRAGEGALTVISAQDGEVWRTPMNDTAVVTQRAINAAELDGLLWGGGTCFEIVLPRTLELGQTYSVELALGSIVTDADNASAGIDSSWTFTVAGDYGVSGMRYRRALGNGKYEEDVTDPQPGDEIRFDLELGGDAVVAAIYGYNGSVDFLTANFDVSCEVVGEVTADSPFWGVVFLDAQGVELNRVEFW